MGAFFDSIPPNILAWIEEQEMFWVATAPLTENGHINVSPKGLQGTFHVINANKVWYEDISGSGAETIAHVKENGRITIMFNAFQGPPRIVRLFGRGTIHEFGTPEYEALIPAEKRHPGSRSAIVIDVFKVGSSCGYAVPFYEFKQHRTALLESMSRREGFEASDMDADDSKRTAIPPESGAVTSYVFTSGSASSRGVKAYWSLKNSTSLDGLPGVISATSSTRLPQSNWTCPPKSRRGKDDIGTDELKLRAKIEESKVKVEEMMKLFGAFLVGVLAVIPYGRISAGLVDLLGRFGVAS